MELLESVRTISPEATAADADLIGRYARCIVGMKRTGADEARRLNDEMTAAMRSSTLTMEQAATYITAMETSLQSVV